MNQHITNSPTPVLLAAALATTAVLAGCSSAYYSAWEMLGQEKRDLLRSNVESVKKEQQAAADEFEDALERLRGLYDIEDDELEKAYDKLKADYDDSKNRAQDIRDRIDKIDSIANDLFKEWDQEIGEISNAGYRQKSRAKLDETRSKYNALAASLEKSEAGMDPVLTHLNDNVLFLKHNLNAAAIGGLAADMKGVETDIEQLIADMRASISEADTFLKTLPE